MPHHDVQRPSLLLGVLNQKGLAKANDTPVSHRPVTDLLRLHQLVANVSLKANVAVLLDDFDLPTAEEGRPIPVVFGTMLLRGPNVVWAGDLKVDPIRKKGGKK